MFVTILLLLFCLLLLLTLWGVAIAIVVVVGCVGVLLFSCYAFNGNKRLTGGRKVHEQNSTVTTTRWHDDDGHRRRICGGSLSVLLVCSPLFAVVRMSNITITAVTTTLIRTRTLIISMHPNPLTCLLTNQPNNDWLKTLFVTFSLWFTATTPTIQATIQYQTYFFL